MSTIQAQIEGVIAHATKEQGWQLRDTSGKHYQLFGPGGAIVTVGRNSTERHAFENFMSEMKRKGYKPPDDREELMEKRESKTARGRLLEYFRKNPDAIVTPQDAIAITGLSSAAIHVALTKLWGSEHIKKLGHGQYRYNAALPDAEPPPPPASNGAAEPSAA
jgi:hypothetical protein